nr:MAG: RNA-dependent RNA polymerase [brine shrimp yue-like virus 3]UNI74165.1 MAG: RNA-dependent RNA polymerase [brine shrimp yue-like virus 3]
MTDTLLTSDNLIHVVLCLAGEESSFNRTTKRRVAMYEKATLTLDGSKDDIVSDFIKQNKKKMLRHLSSESAMSNLASKPVRLDPPSEYNGNTTVWRLFDFLLNSNLFDKLDNTEVYKNIYKRYIHSADSYLYRMGDALSMREKITMKEVIKADLDFSTLLMTMSRCLKILYQKAEDTFKNKIRDIEGKAKAKSNISPFFKDENVRFKSFPVKLQLCADFVLVKISHVDYPLTVVHFKRLTSMLEQFANLNLFMKELGVLTGVRDKVLLFLDLIRPLYLEDSNLVGEVLKGVKSSLIVSLAKDNLISDNQTIDFINSMSAERAKWVKLLMSDLKCICPTVEDSINFLNIYKIIPHPDINTATAFEGLQGLLNPNKIDENLLLRFEGTLRKTLAESLFAQRKQFRLIATNEHGKRLEDMCYDSDLKRAEMLGQSYLSWASIKFLESHQIGDISEITVNPSSKTSLKDRPLSKDEVTESLDWSAFSTKRKPSCLEELITTNDAAEALKGSTGLEFKSAISKFKNVVKAHEDYENSKNVKAPEDISPKDMYTFLMSNPQASYFVGTEGKFGEFHKKTTRMFYIAPENLKTIIQRVERFVKQIFRKSPGVSIVKSYAARRSDLESFARAMTCDNKSTRSIFVSFDMSEFSKKFPMALIRKFGEVLDEITGGKHNWLRRIDLVFRASVVVHNTRGFFDLIGGVKGGFEGFLNFTWSIIHSVIMRIALESTGVSGKLLTFSDDGLLQFYVKKEESKESIRIKIDAIKRTYSALGLEFKVSKTLVSELIWEYLGDVCYHSKLLPSFIKELVSVGKRNINRGLEVFYDRIKSIQAQTGSIINNGGSAPYSYIIKRFLCAGLLEERFGVRDSKLIEWLLITPAPFGGFRITAPTESCLISDVSTDAEYLADLEIYRETYSTIIPRLESICSANGIIQPDFLRTIMAGTAFCLRGLNVSGSKAVSEAIREIKSNPHVQCKIVENPLDGEIGTRLRKLLPLMRDICPVSISRLIQSTPQWSDYTEASFLVKTSGAIRLIRRGSLKRIQSSDSNLCKKAISFWRLEMSCSPGVARDLMESYNLISQKAYFGLSIGPLKLSPRFLFKYTKDNPVVSVTCSELVYRTPSSAEYSEPRVYFPNDFTTLGWSMEQSGDPRSKAIRKFMLESAKSIAYSVESFNVVAVLASCMGFSMPEVFAGDVGSAHRASSGDKSIDVRSLLPRLFDSISSARLVGDYARELNALPRADRRTYLEACRVFTAHFWSMVRRCHPRSDGTAMIRQYNLKRLSITQICQTNEPKAPEKFNVDWPLSPLEKNLKDEFSSSLREYNAFAKDLEMMNQITRAANELSEEEINWYIPTIVKSVENWLVNQMRNISNNILSFRPPPMIAFRPVEVLERAFSGYAWRTMKPDQRRYLADYLRLWRKPPEDYNIPYEAISEFRRMFCQASVLAYNANLPGSSSDYFLKVSEDDSAILNLAQGICLDYDLLTRRRETKKLVIKPSGAIPAKFTTAHKEVYKIAFTNAISFVYHEFAAAGWDAHAETIVPLLGDNADFILDSLYVTRELLRDSAHRDIDHPYNTTTARIELFKFYACARFLYNNCQTKSKNQLNKLAEDFRLNAIHQRTIRARLERAKELGSDHIIILRKGVLSGVIKRILGILRVKVEDGYKKTDLDAPCTMLGWSYYQDRDTGIYYEKTWDSISNQLSSFYSQMISVASSNIVERSASIEKEMMETFVPSSYARSKTFNITVVDTNKIYANIVDIKTLPSEENNALSVLLSAHSKDLVYEQYYPGLSVSLKSSSLLGRACSEVYFEKGPTISLYGEGIESDYYAFFFVFENADTSMHAYLTLSKSRSSSISIFRCKDRAKLPYVVAGIRPKENFPDVCSEAQFKDVLTKPESGKTIDELLDTLTIGAQSKLVNKMALSRIESSGAPNLQLAPIGYMEQFAMTVNSYSEVNDIDERLQAAHLLAKESSCSAHVLNSLVVVCLHLASSRYDFPLLAYSIMYKNARKLILQDLDKAVISARTAHQWLCMINLTAGRHLRDEEILNSIALMRSIQVSEHEFGPGFMTKKPKKFSDVISLPGTLITTIMENIEKHLFTDQKELRGIKEELDLGLTEDETLTEAELASLLSGETSIKRTLRKMLPSPTHDPILTNKKLYTSDESDAIPAIHESLREGVPIQGTREYKEEEGLLLKGISMRPKRKRVFDPYFYSSDQESVSGEASGSSSWRTQSQDLSSQLSDIFPDPVSHLRAKRGEEERRRRSDMLFSRLRARPVGATITEFKEENPEPVQGNLLGVLFPSLLSGPNDERVTQTLAGANRADTQVLEQSGITIPDLDLRDWSIRNHVPLRIGRRPTVVPEDRESSSSPRMTRRIHRSQLERRDLTTIFEEDGTIDIGVSKTPYWHLAMAANAEDLFGVRQLMLDVTTPRESELVDLNQVATPSTSRLDPIMELGSEDDQSIGGDEMMPELVENIDEAKPESTPDVENLDSLEDFLGFDLNDLRNIPDFADINQSE